MICMHCRYELPDTAKFCRSCGKPQLVELLEVSAESAPVKNSKVVSARAKAAANAAAEPAKAVRARARAKAPANVEAEPAKAVRARAKAPANVEAELAKAVRARAKAPANVEAEPAKAVRARAKAPANAEAEPSKVVRARAKAPASAEAEPAKTVRARAKAPANAEAEPAKSVRAKAKAPAKSEAEPAKAVRARAKAPAYAETEPLNGVITKQPATANTEVALASIATSQAVTSIPVVKSKLFVYLAIATVMIAIVCAVGYWGWSQSALPEEQKNLASDSHAEKERLKKETEDKAKQQAIDSHVEEERLKKEAEDKAKQQAEADKSKKEKEESDSKVAETSAALKWTGRYQCSELLLPGAKVINEFSVDIAFTTTSGKGIFLRQTNDFVEKFNVTINAGNVEITSEGSRTADPTKKWFIKTKGTLVGNTINSSGQMFGSDGQQVIRQTCKIQVNK